jgi:hypothetical protein
MTKRAFDRIAAGLREAIDFVKGNGTARVTMTTQDGTRISRDMTFGEYINATAPPPNDKLRDLYGRGKRSLIKVG